MNPAAWRSLFPSAGLHHNFICFFSINLIASHREAALALKRIFSLYCERGIWCIALLLFILLDPHTNRLFSVCPLHLLDIDVCPGCGLGRAVSFLLHGEIMESMRTHILGIPATFFLFLRILTIPPAFRKFTTDQRSIQ